MYLHPQVCLHSTPLSKVLPCPPCMLLILTWWLGSVHKGSGCSMPGKSREAQVISVLQSYLHLSSQVLAPLVCSKVLPCCSCMLLTLTYWLGSVSGPLPLSSSSQVWDWAFWFGLILRILRRLCMFHNQFHSASPEDSSWTTVWMVSNVVSDLFLLESV